MNDGTQTSNSGTQGDQGNASGSTSSSPGSSSQQSDQSQQQTASNSSSTNATGGNSNTSGTQQMGGQQTTQQQQSGAAFKVPDEYKDKPWASKVTSEAELWKQLSNTQELVGRKAIPPDLAKATPEDREAFYAQMRPKDVNEYKFEGELVTPELKGAVGKIFMDNGISAVQGNAVSEAYMKLGEQQQAAMYDPADFEKQMEGAFGKDHKNITGHVFNTIKGMMTPQDQQLMDKLPNAYAAVIYRTLGETVKKFGVTEKDTAHFNNPGNAGSTDVNVVRAGLRGDMAKLSQGPHTAQQMMDLRQQLAKTYENDPRLKQGA